MTNEYGQDVDAMWEADAARQWEELNAEVEVDLAPAVEELHGALDTLNNAITEIHSAAAAVKGFPEEDRIESLAMDLEDTAKWIEQQIQIFTKEMKAG